jgi:hypothetical protein
MENRNTGKPFFSDRGSRIGLIAAITSLVTAGVVLAGFQSSQAFIPWVFAAAIPVILAIIAALSQISAIHINRK